MVPDLLEAAAGCAVVVTGVRIGRGNCVCVIAKARLPLLYGRDLLSEVLVWLHLGVGVAVAIMETLHELTRDVLAAATLESLVCGKGIPKQPKQRTRRRLPLGRPVQRSTVPFDTNERVADVVKACRDERKRRVDEDAEQALDEATLSKYARFTDDMALKPYEPFLHYVPRLVNIVSYTPFFNSSSFSAFAFSSLKS